MDRGVAHDPLEALGDVDDATRVGLLVVGLLQGFAFFQAILEGRRASHDRVGDQLGEAVAGAVVIAEHTRRVAGGGAREHLAERDDLGDRLASVLLGHVAHHTLATAHREIDVNVRHRELPPGVQEALEQQVVTQRVHVGDGQAVGDDRTGRGAAAGADGDTVLLGELDEVPHDQEVGVEAHAVDHPELHVHARQGLGRGRIAVAKVQALEHAFAKVVSLGGSFGGGIFGDQLLVELEFDRATLGDLQSARDRFGPLGESVGHFETVAQIELVGVECHLRRRQSALGLHAQQRGVVVVLAAQIVHVAGAHEFAAHLACDPHDPLVALVLRREAVLLHLEVDVVLPEDSHQVIRVCAGVRGAIVEQALTEARGEASGERDDALGALLDLGQVQRGLASTQPFQETGRGERHEVAIAGVVGREQGEMVALGLARTARGVVVDEIYLAAEDRLDAVLGAGAVKLDHAVHDAVIGESERGLVELGGPLGQVLDLARAIE